MGEFDLIARYFQSRSQPIREGVAFGIGDDCALLNPSVGMQLAISTDMLVEGRHFLSTVEPEALGHKALAVNLSDLAACGAKPLAFTLALSIPRVEEAWLEGFSKGLFALADQHQCRLIGGDTTQGPLNICITVFGEVPHGQALLRSGAKAGDDIYVSGTVGDARLALEFFRNNPAVMGAAEKGVTLQQVRERMERPTPRVALGQALRGVASAALDLSDGLLGDLQHLLNASGVGATVRTDWVGRTPTPASAGHAAPAPASGTSAHLLALPRPQQLELALAGGDDYELLFTAPPSAHAAVQQAALVSATPVTCIGQIKQEHGLLVVDEAGEPLRQTFASFDHFA